MKRVYNWKPDHGDIRDLRFSEHLASLFPLKLPASMDLRAKCSPVVDQGQIGSCTGNAIAGHFEFLEIQDKEYGASFSALSRLFIYWNERALEGTTSQDAGASIRDGIKTLNQKGACRELLWPYRKSMLFKKPAATAYTEAAKHRVAKYMRVSGLDDMRACLAQGFPFVFGFTVYDSFESDAVAKTGIMPVPKKSESVLGGHAVMACGYDDAKKRLIVRNSWGTGWGDKGYFYMPYAVASSTDMADDFWTFRR